VQSTYHVSIKRGPKKLCLHPLRIVERIGDVILIGRICRHVGVRDHEMSPRTSLQPLQVLHPSCRVVLWKFVEVARMPVIPIKQMWFVRHRPILLRGPKPSIDPALPYCIRNEALK
jgi:hypothetical protein